MSTSQKKQAATPRDDARERKAAASAGRAGGYCWVENHTGPGHCTYSPGHSGPHKDFYARTTFE
jgi:hypothetical protein